MTDRPTLADFDQKIFAKPGFAEAYAAMEPERQIKNMLIDCRMAAGLSIEDVAMRMGWDEDAAAAIEVFGAGIPSLEHITAYLKAVGYELRFDRVLLPEPEAFPHNRLALTVAKVA